MCAAGAIQNTYAVSLLQAETLAAAVVHDWRILFAEADSASAPFSQAATELGLDLEVVGPSGTPSRPRLRSGQAVGVVVGTGVDPVTFRFSGGRSAN